MSIDLKQALKHRTPTLGSWITFASEASVEIMARSGFEWLALDMEHSPIDFVEASRLIRIIDLAGVPALCRLPSNDPVLVKQVLDAGASGVIVPSIESAAEAQRAVEAAYYPPAGRRGVGLARAQGYGRTFERYRETVGDRTIVVAMIETERGVAAAHEIAGVAGIDAVLIGPYDLSASLGCIGQLDHPRVVDACTTICKAAAAHAISSGFHIVHVTDEALEAAVAAGHTFLAVGVDMIFLGDAASGATRAARGFLDRRGSRV
jgi:2-dehydro-3-deoxyglucarate aldolase